jgi:hypothetical protein
LTGGDGHRAAEAGHGAADIIGAGAEWVMAASVLPGLANGPEQIMAARTEAGFHIDFTTGYR